jgi:hypothetical protein
MLLVAIACSALSSEPPIPNWGGNAAQFSFSVNATFTDTADAPQHPVWNFSYYYDWNLKAERYDHAPGQHIDVCRVVSIPAGEACTVLAASDGNQYVSSASTGCCHCVASWAPLTILPDWISRVNHSYLGRSMQEGQEADGWVAYGKSANKYYASTDAEQRFLKFSDNKLGREKQWDIREYSAETPPPFLFAPPPNCQTRCPAMAGGCE